MAENLDDFVGHTVEGVTRVDAGEASGALGAEHSVRGPHEGVLEAYAGRSDLDEPGVNVDLVVEPRGGALAHGELYDREVHAVRRPLGVRDRAPSQPFDAGHFHVRDVTRVVHDPHEVRLAEPDAYAYDAEG